VALNAEFAQGEDPHVLVQSPSYFIVRCRYVGCSFQQWWRYEGKSIMYYRTINQFHLFESHMSKEDRMLTNQI